MKPPQVPTLCTDVVGQAGSRGHFCFPWTLPVTSRNYLTSSCSELEGPRLVTHMSGALEGVLGHWPDLQCLRNFPPGLFNSQVNFLHGSLGFQEAGSRILPSLEDQTWIWHCVTFTTFWGSVPTHILGVGDPVPPPRGWGVKEGVTQMECPMIPTAEWQNPMSVVAIFYFYCLHSLSKEHVQFV